MPKYLFIFIHTKIIPYVIANVKIIVIIHTINPAIFKEFFKSFLKIVSNLEANNPIPLTG